MRNTLWFGAVGLACVGGEALAQERFPVETMNDAMLRRRNRISLKATFNFNIKTDFTSATPNNSGALVPGVNRTYDDGFTPGTTWNWG